jgi:hypothetical protein
VEGIKYKDIELLPYHIFTVSECGDGRDGTREDTEDTTILL